MRSNAWPAPLTQPANTLESDVSKIQMTKEQFYKSGGFSNRNLFRVAKPCGEWTYWMML
jgi:hypothetical protein